MRQRRHHPWISVLALAAITGSLLITVPASSSMAQATSYPGEQDPVSGRANGLSQFADDELALVSDAVTSSSYAIKAFSPKPDYTLPDGISSDALPKPPPGNLINENVGYQRQFNVARGRIVDPARDVAVALTRTGFNAQSTTMSWALQELSFGANSPQTKLPTMTFTSQVRNGTSSATSPGALTVGDLDRATDTNGQPHDEIVLAYEYGDGSRRHPDTGLALSVQRYDSASGRLGTSSTAFPLPREQHFAYPCNISILNSAPCDSTYPGTIKLALADVDGDSYKEIALLAQVMREWEMITTLKLFLYSYCPPGLDAGDPRVTAHYCPAQAGGYSLVPRGETVVASGDSSRVANPSFHNPADLVAGDVDGDGLEDLAVVHLLNQRFENPGNLVVNYKYLGDVTLSILAWTAPAGAQAQLKLVWQNPSDKPVATMNAWFDRAGGWVRDPPKHYHDLRIAAGLFRFSPELGYTFGRRQIALAYPPEKERLQLDLWDITSPNTPMPNPPAQWTATSYTKPDTIPYCGDTFASFGLVAGNWAGVKLDPTNPLWGLAVSYEAEKEVKLDLYRVDQKVDPKTGIGPLAPAASRSLPKYGTPPDNDCGQSSRNELLAFDLDGDSLQLGPPLHTVVQIDQTLDYILQEPPQHLDYFPTGSGMRNISRRPDFNVSYGASQSEQFTTTSTKSSDWTVGTSDAIAGSYGYKYSIPGASSGSFDVTMSDRFRYDYNSHQKDYTGSSDSYTTALTTKTGGGDSLQFRAKVIDIWRYPIYGLPPLDKDRPYNYYELYLPRANSTPAQNMDDLSAQTYGYQPQHENGNALSYPAVPSGQSYLPADLGAWLLPVSTTKDNAPKDAVACQNNTRWCISVPVSEAAHQFSWGRNNNSEALQIERANTEGNSREWSHTLKDSLDFGVNAKLSFFGSTYSGCAKFEVHANHSWGEASTTTHTSKETTQLMINVPASQTDATGYHFNPLMYITENGTIKVASSTGFDNGGSFWRDNYSAADPALNLPRKFDQPLDAKTWEINKSWTDAQQLRGTWLRSTTLNPVTKTYDVVDGVQVGSKVFFDTRVYNYSVATPVSQTEVQLSLEQVDPLHNYAPVGKRKTITSQLVGPIPFHGQTIPNSPNVRDNFVPVRFELDTTDLLPADRPSATYRVWLVLDPSDPGNKAGQTHGWRQPNVILTPITSAQAGTTLAVQVQDAAGKVLDTVSYTSQDTDDKLAAGLAAALNKNQHVSGFGAKAQVQDSTTSTPSIVLYKPNTQPPAAYEHRAGIVDGDRALYIVPQQPANGVPKLTATNLEYGQNNEGWGLLTVLGKHNNGPMLGADNCKLSASRDLLAGRDIRLGRNSLAAVPAHGRTDGSKMVVRAGERVPMRVSAFTDDDWAGFERVTVYQGDPANGIVAGTAQIRGISGDSGGHGWFTWKAPLEPGTYELVAQLQHSWYDRSPENNVDTLEVVVEAGPKFPHRTWLGAISR